MINNMMNAFRSYDEPSFAEQRRAAERATTILMAEVSRIGAECGVTDTTKYKALGKASIGTFSPTMLGLLAMVEALAERVKELEKQMPRETA